MCVYDYVYHNYYRLDHSLSSRLLYALYNCFVSFVRRGPIDVIMGAPLDLGLGKVPIIIIAGKNPWQFCYNLLYRGIKFGTHFRSLCLAEVIWSEYSSEIDETWKAD